MTPGFLLALEESHILYEVLSHRGRIRLTNEDWIAVHSFATIESSAREVVLAVVSDGVGGHRAGEVASRTAVEAVANSILNLQSLDDPNAALEAAVKAANLAVLAGSRLHPENEGMGATLVCGLIIDRILYLANLGDSRAYLIRGRKIIQLSYDHTWYEEMSGIDKSNKKDKSRENPLGHVLSRYIGSSHPPDVDMRIRNEQKNIFKKTPQIHGLELNSNDRILLCSDGLTDMLSDDEIAGAVKGKSLRKGNQNLVITALKKGGHDNISVILIEIP